MKNKQMKQISSLKNPSNPTHKPITRSPSTPFPSWFRPRATLPTLNHPHAPPQTTTNPNLTTSLYQTHLGIFSLTWSQSLFSRSLHLHLHPSSLSFHLCFKPFQFWKKQGIKKLQISSTKFVWIFWDFTNARFKSTPEPQSGFYFVVLSQGEMTLFIGDLKKEAFEKTRVKTEENRARSPFLLLRREHVVGRNKLYGTKINLGGGEKSISIELNENFEDEPRLLIKFDHNLVLNVKHLKWKFRGSEKIEVDGHPIFISWDVYNWLFDCEEGNQDDGYALFTFRFEKQGNEEILERERGDEEQGKREKGVVMWNEDSCGLNFERRKLKKRLLMKSRSPSFSSSSLSSISSNCSSVLEWESVEENELKGPIGFSLLVYAWKN